MGSVMGWGGVALGVAAGLAGSALLGATRVGTGPEWSVSALAPAAVQEAPAASDLLAAVAGTPPVACEIVLHALGNRWGGSALRPRVHPPLAASAAERALAEWAWTGRPGPTDTPALLDALGSSDPCVRRVAARLFSALDDPASTVRLVELSSVATGPRRLGALLALAYVDEPEGAEALEQALTADAVDVRRAAAWALGGGGRPESVPALSAALRDPADPLLRENAAWALGRLESRDAVAPLTRGLEDPEAGVRANGAWALGEIQDTDAIPALTVVLSADRDVEVRRAAAWALGRIER